MVPNQVLVNKINALESACSSVLVERSTEIKCSINALLSRRHLCMIGPPGSGKSLLTRTLVSLIDGVDDGEYFEWMLMKFSTPEELFGPVSLSALQNDRTLRATKNKLPEAKIAYLDEAFKASSALLNSLLSIMNERIFHNDDVPVKVPLSTLFASSNETPEDASEIAAMWDRIAFRLITKQIQEDGNFEAMLRSASERFKTGDGTKPVLTPVISWDELVQAQGEVKKVTITREVFEALTDLRKKLVAEGIVPSDRRFVECLPIIQAQAYRDGRDETLIEDMRLLCHVLWNTHSQQSTVQKLVFELANPLDKIALEILEAVELMCKQTDDILKNADNVDQQRRRAVELHTDLQKAQKELSKLQQKAQQENRKSDLIEPIRLKIKSAVLNLIKGVFDYEEDEDDEEETKTK